MLALGCNQGACIGARVQQQGAPLSHGARLSSRFSQRRAGGRVAAERDTAERNNSTWGGSFTSGRDRQPGSFTEGEDWQPPPPPPPPQPASGFQIPQRILGQDRRTVLGGLAAVGVVGFVGKTLLSRFSGDGDDAVGAVPAQLLRSAGRTRLHGPGRMGSPLMFGPGGTYVKGSRGVYKVLPSTRPGQFVLQRRYKDKESGKYMLGTRYLFVYDRQNMIELDPRDRAMMQIIFEDPAWETYLIRLNPPAPAK